MSRRKSKCTDAALVMFPTDHQYPGLLASRGRSVGERLCGCGMPEDGPSDDEDSKWPDWTWIALLVLAGLLTGFVALAG